MTKPGKVVRLAVAFSLVGLGGCFCAPSTNEGGSSGALGRFVPVRVVSLDEASPVVGIELVRPGTAFVVLGRTSPDHWAVFPDGTALHVEASGTADAPGQATLTWGDARLTLDYDGAEIVGGSLLRADGTTLTYEGGGGAPTRTQPVTAEEIEAMDQIVDNTLRYFAGGCAHPVVEFLCDGAREVQDVMNDLEAATDEWRQLADYVPPETEPGEEPAATAREELYTEAPIGPSLSDDVGVGDIVALAAEIEARRAAEQPQTNHLPDDVSVATGNPDAPLADASWTPALLTCIKEFKDRGTMARIEQACAGTPMDCEEGGGYTGPRRTDCDDWCQNHESLKPMLSSDETDTGGELLCAPFTCVEAFSRDDDTAKPLENEQCCFNGFVHEVCGEPSENNPDECSFIVGVQSVKERCLNYSESYSFIVGNPAESLAGGRQEIKNGSVVHEWAFQCFINAGSFNGEPSDYFARVTRFDGDTEISTEEIWVSLELQNNGEGTVAVYDSSTRTIRDFTYAQGIKTTREETTICNGNNTRKIVTVYSNGLDSTRDRLEDTTIEGSRNCSDVADVISLAASEIPVPMSWDYVLTMPAYIYAQGLTN